MVLRIIRGQDTNVRRARLHGELSQVSTTKAQRVCEAGLLLLQVEPWSIQVESGIKSMSSFTCDVNR